MYCIHHFMVDALFPHEFTNYGTSVRRAIIREFVGVFTITLAGKLSLHRYVYVFFNFVTNSQ